MNEKPILFSGEMVRAILDGRKTQTRRIVKSFKHFVPSEGVEMDCIKDWDGLPSRVDLLGDNCDENSPYGQVGDRLWVKETHLPKASGIIYRADFDKLESAGIGALYGGWKPSIFMPRKLSRINLEITKTKVERLNDISEEDAKAEGCIMDGNFPKQLPDKSGIGEVGWDDCIEWYSYLWESINGVGSWALNPWVWVIEFKRV